MNRQFPIMIGYVGTKGPCPSSIPWDAIAPYEGQAQINHQQSLARLAERGGLSPEEAFLVMTGRSWIGEMFTEEFNKEACAFLNKIVRDREELRVENVRLEIEIGHHVTALKSANALLDKITQERDDAVSRLDDIFKLHAATKTDHGTCEPRMERACTACNAKDDLWIILERGVEKI